MTPKEIKSFFDIYPNAEIYKVGTRFFLSKDKNLAEDYARTKELEVETINANTKLGKDAADDAAKKAADDAAKKAADEAAKKAADEENAAQLKADEDKKAANNKP